jgi:ribulose-5-phosphate 4-epimerase/fuculose-1-phosphate aldolase
MAGTEGVIKFTCEFTPAPALAYAQIAELNAWRKIMYMTALIGQDPARYGGYGFGNISCRLDAVENDRRQHPFAITGTQTGGKANLTAADYVVVTACYPAENRLVAHGPLQPSSESLTHGTIYAADSRILWVVHAHSPEIWRHAVALNLPMTGDVPYGTPEMAVAVQRLFAESDLPRRRIFGMAGHEDGIVTFGRTAEEAGGVMLNTLAQALRIE